MYSKENISNFLAFTIWPKANYISIEDLNSIKLQDNSNKDIDFFKNEILSIFNSEINSYWVKNWENIWILLSWWLDSTFLLDLLSKKFNKSKIFTYTLWYSYNDEHLEKAKKISDIYWTIHKEIVYNLENNFFETLDDIYSFWYDLEWEDSLIMNHILSKYVEKDCKIVFSGFGLDYVFAWMDLFRNSFFERLYNNKL
jgi:hypothetical protein